MGLMGAGWHYMGLDYQYCTLEAVIKTLGTDQPTTTATTGKGGDSIQVAGGEGEGEEGGGGGGGGGAKATSSSSSSSSSLSSPPRRQSHGGNGGRGGGTTPQAVANIVYSLGVAGAQWADFPSQVRSAIFQGLKVRCTPSFLPSFLPSFR